MSDDKSIRVKVIEVTRWAPTLPKFKVTRPDGFKFTAGQLLGSVSMVKICNILHKTMRPS